MRKSAVFSFRVTVRRRAPFASAWRDTLAERPQPPRPGRSAREVAVEGRLGRDALGRRVGLDPAVVLAARETVEPAADGAVARDQLALASAAVADRGDAVGAERRPSALPTPQIRLTGLAARKPPPRRGRSREAARLVQVGGDLGEELVVAEADRDGDADARASISQGQARPGCGPGCRVQPLGAGEIEEGLVDRQRLDQRRQSPASAARTSRPTRLVFRHVGRITTASGRRQRLEHRHGRAHAVDARDVAGGRDHAALAAADDDRLVAQAAGRRASRRRHRRRRSRDGRWRESVELGMGDQARRAAGRAAGRPGRARSPRRSPGTGSKAGPCR